MTTQPDNGGPAFPTHDNVNDPRCDGFMAYPGMTLRDWFAGQALIGVLRDPSETSRKAVEFALEDLNAGRAPQSSFIKLVAHSCYAYADALITQRNKETKL